MDASVKTARMYRSPSPNHLDATELMETLRKLAPASVATALASMVLPVPGGPNSKIPCGDRIPAMSSSAHSDAGLGLVMTSELEAGSVQCGRGGLKPRAWRQALEDEEKFGTFARRAITVLAKGGTS